MTPGVPGALEPRMYPRSGYFLLEYFKKYNWQSNHPKLENIDHTEFKNDIQMLLVLEIAKQGPFENLTKSDIQ